MYPAAIVRFNKEQDYQVYKARIDAGLNVRASQIIDHRMVGKVVLVDGKRYFVESAHKYWSRGYYIVLMINNFSDSHGQLFFETIGNCYDEVIMNCIARCRAKVVFTSEPLGEKEQQKIARTYKIGKLLSSNLIRKRMDWKEEREIVEKAGLTSA